MARRTAKTTDKKKPIDSYDHKDKKRANNPPVGLVTPDTDPDHEKKRTYEYDPHLHPRKIIEAVRKRNGVARASSVPEVGRAGKSRQDACATYEQLPLFEQPEQNPPLREAIEFYKHARGWTSLYPSQVFFPMAGPKDGWARLAKNLKAEIDEELIEAYRGTISLPFEPGEHQRVAVKIIDDRGIERLKIVEVV